MGKIVVVVEVVALLVEAVHVELAQQWSYLTYKRRIFLMFEVLWQDLLGKSFEVFNHEAVSCLSPAHYFTQIFALYSHWVTSSISQVLLRKAGTFFFFYIITLNDRPFIWIVISDDQRGKEASFLRWREQSWLLLWSTVVERIILSYQIFEVSLFIRFFSLLFSVRMIRLQSPFAFFYAFLHFSSSSLSSSVYLDCLVQASRQSSPIVLRYESPLSAPSMSQGDRVEAAREGEDGAYGICMVTACRTIFILFDQFTVATLFLHFPQNMAISYLLALTLILLSSTTSCLEGLKF